MTHKLLCTILFAINILGSSILFSWIVFNILHLIIKLLEHLKCYKLLSLKECVEAKIFRQKLCDIEGGCDIKWYYWFDFEWCYQGQSKDTLNLLNETLYFLLHIFVVYLESFSTHYNNIQYFFIKYFSSYKAWKLQCRQY